MIMRTYEASLISVLVFVFAVAGADISRPAQAVEKTKSCGLVKLKANRMARLGKLGHLTPGRLPGAKCEGVGYSTRSSSKAVRNCCYYGKRKVIACAVTRGRRGWYACCQYR